MDIGEDALSYLCTTLNEITDGGRSEPGEKRRRSLFSDDCAGGLDHVIALQGIVDLNPRFHDIDGSCGLDRIATSVSELQLTKIPCRLN